MTKIDDPTRLYHIIDAGKEAMNLIQDLDRNSFRASNSRLDALSILRQAQQQLRLPRYLDPWIDQSLCTFIPDLTSQLNCCAIELRSLPKAIALSCGKLVKLRIVLG